jgi:hypothetical protein
MDIPEEAKDWTLREVAHINGGSAFFGYIHQCDQQPRLQRFDRYDRKARSVTSTWRVDGKDQPDLATAVAALAANAEPHL